MEGELSFGTAWRGAAQRSVVSGATRRGALRVGGSMAAAGIGLLAAACGGQPGASAPQPANLTGTLVYRDWRLRSGNPVDEAFYKAVRDGFLAKYPNAKWEQEQVDFGKVYLEKMVASAAAGTSPQAVFSSIIWARDLWEQGLLEDLGSYIAKTPSVASMPLSLRSLRLT